MISKNYKRYLGIAAIIVIVLLVERFSPAPLRNAFFSLIQRPGGFVIEKLGQVSKFSRGLRRFNKIIDENAQLRQENLTLLGNTALLQKLERENKILREQLKISSGRERVLIMAKIFTVNRNDLVSVILIDKGSRDGLEKSMPVIAGGNVAVGLIKEVFENSSVIMILDDPRLATAVRVGDQGTLGSTRGRASGKIILELITNKDPIKEGDLVVTSGLDNFPDGLLVGRVTNVQLEGGNLFKKVEVTLLFDLSLGPNLFILGK